MNNIDCLGMFPEGNKLNDQDISTVHWYTVITNLKKEQEIEELNKVIHNV